MEHTGYVLPDWSGVDVAHGYDIVRFGSPLDKNWADDGPWWNLRANGGILSTASDMARWHRALEDGTVLAPETVERWHTGLVPECAGCEWRYAYGILDTGEDGYLWHDGGNGFFFVQFMRWKDVDRLLFTVTNNAKAREDSLPWRLAEMVDPAL